MAAPEVVIESLAAGGDGVAHLDDGRVVFVRETCPGDRVSLRIDHQGKNFARASVLELREAGSARVAPPCAVFGKCGGCSWQHIDYPAQIEAKTRILRDAIERIGGFLPPDEVVVRASRGAYGYRTRARIMVSGTRVGFRSRGSNEICAIDSCPILAPELDAELRRLVGTSSARRAESEFELLAGEGKVVRAVEAPSAPEQGWRRTPTLTVNALGERVRVSPGVFVQGNAYFFEDLVRAVLRSAAPEGSEAGLVIEFHSGAGFFTLPLSRRFDKVIAVEANRRAVSDLEANCVTAGIENIEVVASPAADAIKRLASHAPNCVVVDPPRTGLERDVADGISKLGADRIVYLSCDPATLARDLARMMDRGYRLASLEGFDLFPQTPHVEALAVLVRAGG
ncbi:MAG: class I SAM-dependent RNA methyltransferase [Myxococcota bacterium]